MGRTDRPSVVSFRLTHWPIFLERNPPLAQYSMDAQAR